MVFVRKRRISVIRRCVSIFQRKIKMKKNVFIFLQILKKTGRRKKDAEDVIVDY